MTLVAELEAAHKNIVDPDVIVLVRVITTYVSYWQVRIPTFYSIHLLACVCVCVWGGGGGGGGVAPANITKTH